MAVYGFSETAVGGTVFGTLDTVVAATGTTLATGWTVGTNAASYYSKLDMGVTRAKTTFATTVLPTAGALDTTLGDAFRTAAALNGSFASGNWSFSVPLISSVSTGTGKLIARVYRSTSVDGSTGLTEITSAAQSFSTYTDSTAGATTTLTWAAPAVTFANEYLFVQVAYEVLSASSTSTATVKFRSGGSVTTTAFVTTINAQATAALTLGASATVAVQDNAQATAALTFGATGTATAPPPPGTMLFQYAPGDTGYTETRPTTAVYTDVNGAEQTAASGVLRDSHYIGGVRRTLTETQRTNYLLQSDAPATQTVSLASGTYTLWIVGSGSVALSGGPTGTATASRAVTFTLNATTSVTFTVSGTVSRFQCENGGNATSYIATTSATATRAGDYLYLPFTALPQVMTVFAKTVYLGGGYVAEIGGSNSPHFELTDNGGIVRANMYVNGGNISLNSQAAAIGDTREYSGVLYADGSVQLSDSINGAAVVTSPVSTSPGMPAAWAATRLVIGSNDSYSTGFLGVESVKIVSGVQTLDYMRTAGAAPIAGINATATAALSFGAASSATVNDNAQGTAALAFGVTSTAAVANSAQATASLTLGASSTATVRDNATATAAMALGASATGAVRNNAQTVAALVLGATGAGAVNDNAQATAALALGATASASQSNNAQAAAALQLAASSAGAVSNNAQAMVALAIGATSTATVRNNAQVATTLTFGASATAAVANTAQGTASLAFNATSTATVNDNVQSVAALTFGLAASGVVRVQAQSNTTLALSASGTATATSGTHASVAAILTLGASGSATVNDNAASVCALALGATGSAVVQANAAAVAALVFGATSTATALAQATGTAALSLGVAAAGAVNDNVQSVCALSFGAQATSTVNNNAQAACTLNLGASGTASVTASAANTAVYRATTVIHARYRTTTAFGARYISTIDYGSEYESSIVTNSSSYHTLQPA